MQPDISTVLKTPKFWNLDHSGLSYGNFHEKNKYFAPLQRNLVILPIFFIKMAITQPRMIQIPKFWCLKSCTNIWLHFGNIHSIQKINRIELEGKKGSKFAKIGQFFTLQNIKIEITKFSLHEQIIRHHFSESIFPGG